MGKWFMFTFILIVSFFHFESMATAQSGNVEECLQTPDNCEDLLETESETDSIEAETELLGGDSNTGSLLLEVVKLFFALLLVLALIYLFLYFLKRRQNIGARIKTLENVGGVSVGQNKSVQLVRFANCIYMIGVGDNVTLLKEFEDELLVKEIMKDKEEQTQDFIASSLLSAFFQKKKNKEDNEDNFTNLFQQELKNLKHNRKNIISRHKEDHNE